ALFAGLADFYLPAASRGALLDAIAGTRWQQDPALDRCRLSRLIVAQAPAPATPAESNLRRDFDEIQALVGHDSLPDIAARLSTASEGDTWLAAAAVNFRKGSP